MSWSLSIPDVLVSPGPLDRAFEVRDDDLPWRAASFAPRACFDFRLVLTRPFRDVLHCLAVRSGAKAIRIAAIDPGLRDYYLPNFGVVPAIAIDADASAQSYLDVMHWEPRPEGADSIAVRADVIVMFVEPLAWIILAERRFELARLLVDPVFDHLDLKTCIPSEWRFSVDELISHLGRAGIPLEAAGRVARNLR